jgi:hypothetical protein
MREGTLCFVPLEVEQEVGDLCCFLLGLSVGTTIVFRIEGDCGTRVGEMEKGPRVMGL